MSGFLVGSTPWLRVDWAEGEKMELPSSLGPGTKLGLLGHLLTCIGLHRRSWVQNLGTIWEGVRHPRPPSMWVVLHYALLGHI